jgi:hypothetical protein
VLSYKNNTPARLDTQKNQCKFLMACGVIYFTESARFLSGCPAKYIKVFWRAENSSLISTLT